MKKFTREAIIAAIGDGISIHDTNLEIIFQNETCKKSWGSHLGEQCFRAYQKRDTLCDDCQLVETFKNGRTITVEKKIPGPQGMVHLEITSSPVKNAEGTVIAGIELFKDITERKRMEETLRKSREELDILVQERTSELTMLTEQLRNLSVHLQQAREEERTKIAREVHDDLGQSLTALNMDLAFLQRNIPAELTVLTERTNAMAELIGMTMQSIRRISTDLRPGILDVLGLAAAIEWQAGEYEKRTGIACEVSCESADVDLDRDCATTLFRIFQESLTNISRHARATKMSVSLNRAPGSLVLTVIDNGKGIDEDQESGRNSFGLIGMRERALSLGGEVSISSRPNMGTEVMVRIPLHDKESIR